MGYEPPSISWYALVDYSKPLAAKRAVAFARAFKRVSKQRLQGLA